MKDTETLEYLLNNFVSKRLESSLWDKSYKIKNYDINEDLIMKNTKALRNYFNGNKEIDNMLLGLLDACSNQLFESQIEAYKLGLKDGLNFKETL